MKALVTGAAGMLGSALTQALSAQNYLVTATDIVDNDPDIGYLDVRNMDDLKQAIKTVEPDIVFHLAALTNVDECQIKPDQAYITNTLGTENVAFACMNTDITVVYISTGAVFDGNKASAYIEFDRPDPLNLYAKSKLEGEKIVRNVLNKYFIVRAGWMIGGFEKDKKFVAKIIGQLEQKDKKEIMAVTDKKGSPTFTKDFAGNLLDLVPTGRYGTYHMANKGSCSRYDIAKKIVQFMEVEDVQVQAVTSERFPLPAPRGNSEALENYKLELLSINNMPTWEDALKEYIVTVKNNRALT